MQQQHCLTSLFHPLHHCISLQFLAFALGFSSFVLEKIFQLAIGHKGSSNQIMLLQHCYPSTRPSADLSLYQMNNKFLHVLSSPLDCGQSGCSSQTINSVQTVGISNAVRTDNNLVDAYQLSKAQFGLTPLNSIKKSITPLVVRSLPDVPGSPLAPEQGMTW